MNEMAVELGEAYLNALNQKDIDQIAAMVHPEIKFKSPMAEATGNEQFLAAARRMMSSAREVQVRAKFSSDNQAVFAYDVVFGEPVGTVRAVSMMTFEGDKIKEIELFFDARPFEKAHPQQQEMKLAA